MPDAPVDPLERLDEWIASALVELEQIRATLAEAPPRQTTPTSKRLISNAIERLAILGESGREAQVYARLAPQMSKPFRRPLKSQQEANEAARLILERLIRDMRDRVLNVAWIESEFEESPDDGILRHPTRSSVQTWTLSFAAVDDETGIAER